MFLTGRYYFSDNNKKNFYRSINSIDEKINLYAEKLPILEEDTKNIIEYTKPSNNKKTNLYILTEKGLSLIPIIIELAIWGDTNLQNVHPSLDRDNPIEYIKLNKEKFVGVFKNQYLDNVAEVTL